MMLLAQTPERPYVAFIEPRELPWWAYDHKRRTTAVGRSRRLLGRALIKAGRALAAPRRAEAVG